MGSGDSQPVQGLEGARRLSGQLSRATVLLFLAIIATVVGALVWAAHQSDTISVQRQERVAKHAIQVALDDLALQQETVAIWDDAAEHMVAQAKDQQWLFDNMGSWLHRIFDHDETWLIDQQDRPVQVVVAGRLAAQEHYWRRPKDVEPLIRQARGEHIHRAGRHDRNVGQPPAPNSTVQTTERSTHDTHLTLVHGRPAAVSAMLIQPSTKGYVSRPAQWPVLVSIRYFDGGFISELQAKHLIDQPRFSRSGGRSRGEYALPIDTEAGDNLGYLIWRPELTGSRITATLVPAYLVALALLALLMGLLLRRLTQSLHDRGALEERANHLAYHDSLTGLPNRTFFNDRVKQALGDSGKDDVALLLIDLDRFKQVNDTLGHLAGDELIRQFADRLVDALEPTSSIARLGGDEFAILLRGDNAAAALDCCDTILGLFDRPFGLMGTSIHASASIGAAKSQGVDIGSTELMRRADVALYRAKADGRSCGRLFEDQMDSATQLRTQLEVELREAVASGQFALWRQPQVDRHRNIVAQELLLRWQHPHLGIVSPELILPIAEETGLMIPIGDWVLRQAIAVAAEADRRLITAVNLSAVQLRDPNFAATATTLCEAAGVDPQMIELEITEQTLLDDNRVTRLSLRRLRRAGFRIALDDFGTGYSSLGYLRRFTVDKVKIDRSFVADVERSPEARAIIAAIVTLGRALGVSISAEGVETAQQEEILLLAGCDQLQGHLYAAAQPLAQDERSAA